jgi:hypothetical protein
LEPAPEESREIPELDRCVISLSSFSQYLKSTEVCLLAVLSGMRLHVALPHGEILRLGDRFPENL